MKCWGVGTLMHGASVHQRVACFAVDAPCLDRKRSPVEETSGGGRAHAKVSGGGGDAPCIGHGLRAG